MLSLFIDWAHVWIWLYLSRAYVMILIKFRARLDFYHVYLESGFLSVPGLRGILFSSVTYISIPSRVRSDRRVVSNALSPVAALALPSDRFRCPTGQGELHSPLCHRFSSPSTYVSGPLLSLSWTDCISALSDSFHSSLEGPLQVAPQKPDSRSSEHSFALPLCHSSHSLFRGNNSSSLNES